MLTSSRGGGQISSSLAAKFAMASTPMDFLFLLLFMILYASCIECFGFLLVLSLPLFDLKESLSDASTFGSLI